jgi:hypothetical protein
LLERTARFKAAIMVALETNAKRTHHPTLHSIVNSVLRKLKTDAGV